MMNKIDTENKSTKEVILDYLKLNRGREIAVSEISEKFNYKLNRISNAIKELELSGEILIDRRPLKKGKYTVIWLKGDNITEFASHERELNPKSNHDNGHSNGFEIEEFSLDECFKILNSVDYKQNKIRSVIEPYFDNYYLMVTEFINPLMVHIGELWEKGQLSIAEEHLISARLEKYIIDLISHENNNVKSRRSNKIIILAPVENEHHTLVLLTLELLLTERGFKVINLSRTISILSIIEFIRKMKIKPDWIFFSITMPSYVNNLKMDVKLIEEELHLDNLQIAIGGQGIRNIDPEEFPEASILIKNNEDLQNLLFSL